MRSITMMLEVRDSLAWRISARANVHLIGTINEFIESSSREPFRVVQLDRLVGIHNESNEQTEYDVDEETDESVQVNPTEPPENHGLVRHSRKGRKHVIPINECKETLGSGRE